MGFNCGIVGLPNVGKSTLFNALTKAANAEAANYPFCTIEPNVGRVGVPDDRLYQLAKIAGSAEIIPTPLEFVDIAGIVKGASQGEGLGNKFLSHIREVDAIIHVVRCFEDDDITHVSGSVDPVRDVDVIRLELILADLESVEKRIPQLEKKIRGQDKEAKVQLDLLMQAKILLEEEKMVSQLMTDADSAKVVKSLQLLTSKPMLYVANVNEDEVKSGNHYTEALAKKAKEDGADMRIISAKIESEISALDDEEEQLAFLEELGLQETGLSQIIKAGYQILDLLTFFTIGPKEAHAWTVRQGALAPEAAGVIHTDFEKGFIRAETISTEEFIACGGEQPAKEQGKMRLEGKDYMVHDGDIFHFRFNV